MSRFLIFNLTYNVKFRSLECPPLKHTFLGFLMCYGNTLWLTVFPFPYKHNKKTLKGMHIVHHLALLEFEPFWSKLENRNYVQFHAQLQHFDLYVL